MYSKKWVKLYLSIIIVFGIFPYFLMFIFLSSNFENNLYADIVKRQIKNESIYGTALNQNTYTYKLELVKHVEPDILALGSSRVMQFRKENFNTSFVNAGGAMNNLNEGMKFLENMLLFHKPKVIILGLDFWWFNDKLKEPVIFNYHNNKGNVLSYKKMITPIKWLKSEKISFDTVANIFDNNEINNKYTNYDNLGFQAISTSNGFRVDGSYFYSKEIFGVSESNDINFKFTKSRIKNNEGIFTSNNVMSEEKKDKLKRIINLINKNKIDLIILIPPLSNTMNNYMSNYSYEYINQFRNYISTLNTETFDFQNISFLNNNDCEFVDGFHGGDVLYSRILKEIGLTKSLISNFLNFNHIDFVIETFKGKALSIVDRNKYNLDEIDFLKLGCVKKTYIN